MTSKPSPVAEEHLVQIATRNDPEFLESAVSERPWMVQMYIDLQTIRSALITRLGTSYQPTAYAFPSVEDMDRKHGDIRARTILHGLLNECRMLFMRTDLQWPEEASVQGVHEDWILGGDTSAKRAASCTEQFLRSLARTHGEIVAEIVQFQCQEDVRFLLSAPQEPGSMRRMVLRRVHAVQYLLEVGVVIG